MTSIAKEQFERENGRYPLTNQKFDKNLLGSIKFTGLSKKKWTPGLSFRHFLRCYSLLISLLVVMLLSVVTTSDYHIHMTYSHNQKLNLVFSVFQQERKLLSLHQKSQQKKLLWAFSKVYDQPDLVSIKLKRSVTLNVNLRNSKAWEYQRNNVRTKRLFKVNNRVVIYMSTQKLP